jgi:hypothetical protein
MMRPRALLATACLAVAFLAPARLDVWVRRRRAARSPVVRPSASASAHRLGIAGDAVAGILAGPRACP